MSQSANNQKYKITRGVYKGEYVKVLLMYTNRKGKKLAVTNKILKGKEIKGEPSKTKRKLVVSIYSLLNELS